MTAWLGCVRRQMAWRERASAVKWQRYGDWPMSRLHQWPSSSRKPKAALGPNHRDTALRLGNLTQTLSDLGRHSEAMPLKERALQVTETALGPNHPTTAFRRSALARLRQVVSDRERTSPPTPLRLLP